MITSEIVENCTGVIRQNMQKIIFAVMTMFIISQFCLVIVSGIAMAFTAVSSVLGIAVLMTFLFFVYGLFFGFCALMLLFTRSQYGVIGHLFYGFKNLKRLLQTSTPFVLIIMGSCFAACMVAIGIAPGADPVNDISQGTIPNILTTASYISVILTVLLYLPFVFLPFAVFDFAGESVKTCRKRAFFIFKSTCKILFKAFVKVCKKNLLLLLACIVLIAMGSKTGKVSALSALAVPFCVITVYVIFVKTITLCAVVYNQFYAEQNQQAQNAENAETVLSAETVQSAEFLQSAETVHPEQIAEFAENSEKKVIIQLETTENTEKLETGNQGEAEL